MMTKILDVYTDGSFNGKNASWAFVVIQDNKPLFSKKGVLYGDINSMWQIGGEIKAAENAVLWAKESGCRININYDYIGVENWALGNWKTKNPHTKAYKEFMQNHKDYVNSYVKIKSHSFNKWNDFADALAKI